MIEFYDFKGFWWTLAFVAYRPLSRAGFQEAWLLPMKDGDNPAVPPELEAYEEYIPIPVFTEWWEEEEDE